MPADDDIAALVGVRVGVVTRAGADKANAGTVIRISSIAAIDVTFEIVIAIGLQDGDTVVIAILWPAGLSRVALGVESGGVVDVPDHQPALRNGAVETGVLAVFDQEVFLAWIAGIDTVNLGMCFRLVDCVLARLADHRRAVPAQIDLGPR